MRPSFVRTPPEGAPVRTIPIPIDLLGLDHITVVAAPPALVTRQNASYLGMTGDAVIRVLHEMKAHPHYREHVIARGKFRAAPPDAILAYLREVPEAASDEAGEDESEIDEGLLRAAGFAAPPAGVRSKGGRR